MATRSAAKPVGPVARPQEVACRGAPRRCPARASSRSASCTSGGIDIRIALGAAARLQAEQRAAVPDQVELDVAAAPVGLEVALALAVRHVLAALRRSAGRRRGNASPTLRVSAKQRSKPPSAKSSKKMPPMPRGSLRCLRKKYSSHQRLKRGWTSAPNGASASRHARWKCTRVLLEAVVRRQVHAAAEPPAPASPPAGARDEHAHVHVHGRHVRDCAGGARATRPSPPTARRRARARCGVADGGSAPPVTCEKLHAAALEHARRPRSCARCRRLPPPGRVHSSRRNGRRRSLRALRRCAACSSEQVVAQRRRVDGGHGHPAALTLARRSARWPMSRAVLHAVEVDARQRRVGALLRLPAPSRRAR